MVGTGNRATAILKGFVLFLLFVFLQALFSGFILVFGGWIKDPGLAPLTGWHAVVTVIAATSGVVFADIVLKGFFKGTYSKAIILTTFLSIWILLTAASLILLKPSILLTQDGLRSVVAIATAGVLRWRLARSSRAEQIASTFDDQPTVQERVPFLKGLTSMAAVAAGCVPQLGFFIWGLVQLSAVYAQVHAFTHLSSFFSGVLSLALTYVPLIGGVVGFFGAKDVWGWLWWQAALLYFAVPIGLMLLSIMLAVVGSASGKRFA